MVSRGLTTLTVLILATNVLRAAEPSTGVAYGTNGETPLMIVAAKGDIVEVERRLKAGDDVNARTEERGPKGELIGGWTPLLLAAREGRVEVARRLLKNGANVHTRTANGRTCLGEAILETVRDKENGPKTRLALVKLFLAAKADPNVATGHGEYPLHLAALFGHTDAASLLIQAGAKVDAIHRIDHATPLMYAARNGHADVVRLLLKHCADRTARNKSGWTAVEIAKREKHDHLADLLATGR